jgi:site-specific DNA recombinase
MPSRSLTSMRSGTCNTVQQPIQVVLYLRVSSKDQEKDGFSIPAQARLLREYAARMGFTIVHEFEDIETAKRSGRTHFNEMIAYLRQHHARCRTILVENTDRLYRNTKDWVTLDELDVEIHFVKENSIISQNSRSSEKLIHGMKVLFAKNTIDNLSEETKKGMLEKARVWHLPQLCAGGLSERERTQRETDHRSEPANGPDDFRHIPAI